MSLSPMPKTAASEPPTTVIELFQSQGCSSCPPTNANVLELLHDPDLLILTYHVTYWDYLGWKDTFGKTVFDQRQREYAKTLQRRNVYTPQVVINGLIEGVGNNVKDLQALISKGKTLGTTKTAEILYPGSGNVIQVSGLPNERGVVTLVDYDSEPIDVPIPRGENKGRTLPHNNVVKDITQLGAWTGGTQEFQIPRQGGGRRAVLVSAGVGGPILGVTCL